MSFYLVAGHGASTAAPVPGGHLPTAGRRVYPSDTGDTEWNLTRAWSRSAVRARPEAVDPCGIPGVGRLLARWRS